MRPEQIIVNELGRLKVPAKAFAWIVAQSAHETAKNGKPWNSRVFLIDNNGFGMKQPKIRPTTSKGPGTAAPAKEGATPYASYSNFADSVQDLVLWLKYNKVHWASINSESEYVSFLLKKGYFGASFEQYLKGVRYWLSKISIPPAAGFAGVLLIAALLFYAFK